MCTVAVSLLPCGTAMFGSGKPCGEPAGIRLSPVSRNKGPRFLESMMG
jgi:hypothetical protein